MGSFVLVGCIDSVKIRRIWQNLENLLGGVEILVCVCVCKREKESDDDDAC